jgi:Flp pilus assembly pilin Flp
MTSPARLRRVARDLRGSTIVEFALIFPVLCMVLLALFDLGYRSYVAAVLQGSMHEAARLSTVGGKTPAQIDAHITTRLRDLSNDGTIVVITRSYSAFADIQKPEKITQDTAPLLAYNVGDCYEDANGNHTYDLDRGTTGLGGADDIVNYQVSITFNRLVPLGYFLGWSDTQAISGSTVLRNQPFAARTSGVQIVCN